MRPLPCPDRTVVVEVIGPAGAGKSTLVRDLRARDPRRIDTLSLWGLSSRWWMSGMLALLRSWRAVGWRALPDRAVLLQMIRVHALARAVDCSRGRRRGVLILDEGPVFALSWFDVFAPHRGDPGYPRWRQRVIAEWAARLDAVVILDASDDTLVRRIRTRPKPHMVKGWAPRDIDRFTASFRRAFARVLTELAAAAPVAVQAIRTDDVSPTASSATLRAALEALPGVR